MKYEVWKQILMLISRSSDNNLWSYLPSNARLTKKQGSPVERIRKWMAAQGSNSSRSRPSEASIPQSRIALFFSDHFHQAVTFVRNYFRWPGHARVASITQRPKINSWIYWPFNRRTLAAWKKEHRKTNACRKDPDQHQIKDSQPVTEHCPMQVKKHSSSAPHLNRAKSQRNLVNSKSQRSKFTERTKPQRDACEGIVDFGSSRGQFLPPFYAGWRSFIGGMIRKSYRAEFYQLSELAKRRLSTLQRSPYIFRLLFRQEHPYWPGVPDHCAWGCMLCLI